MKSFAAAAATLVVVACGVQFNALLEERTR